MHVAIHSMYKVEICASWSKLLAFSNLFGICMCSIAHSTCTEVLRLLDGD